MINILTSCIPRKDIVEGTFNPEIFTASLDAVLKVYRGETSGLHSVYSQAEDFFREATYPSQGLKTVVQEVFLRLSGVNTVPAIHRLETGFGGGKTHTLIACAHIGWRGKTLAGMVDTILDPMLLPDPGEVCVVGIAGDKLPVRQPRGTRLLPHTLWGEIAFQVGGEPLYREVEPDAESYAAPGENYFQMFAMVGLNAVSVDIDDMVTTVGPNRPRIEQNHVVMLVPETVTAKLRQHGQESLFEDRSDAAQVAADHLKELGRTVLALRKLDKDPQTYGIQPQKLQKDDFRQRYREREKAMETAVTESYRQMWYPSARGQIVCKEIRTAGGEGGVAVLEQIRKMLIEDGELITPLTFRGNLPLDTEAGSKLALIFKLQERIQEMDRVELIARRVDRFTREEAGYWLSRITTYGDAANRWALAGMKLMLGGQPGDKSVAQMLDSLRG